MDILAQDKLILFLLFFVPGFISIKVYDMFVPGDRRDFTQAFPDAVAYSSVNYAILSPLIIFIHSNNFSVQHKFMYSLFAILILFVFPVIWPILFVKLTQCGPLVKHFRHPMPTAWDYLFSKKESFFVILHLKDNTRIGGIYDTNSFASSYPHKQQIYLEKVCKIDAEGKFVGILDRTGGIIVSGDDIKAIEFYR